MTSSISKKGLINPISSLVFVSIVVLDGILTYFEVISLTLTIIGVLLAVFTASAVKIADQWEKAVVLRMGKFRSLRGPGPFIIIPIIDRVHNYIDQRVRITDFKAEETLTKDTVPTNVDAVVYWTVWDVEKAALEVQDYINAVAYIAQTGLRDIIGQHELADLLQNRETIAAKKYQNDPIALHLRGMNMLFEGLKEKGSLIIVPSSALESMNLGSISGLAALAKATTPQNELEKNNQ